MKALLFLFLALPCLADNRWFELRCSPTHPVTNYVVAAGKAVYIADYWGPNQEPESQNPLRLHVVRPEGVTYVGMLYFSTVIGPATISMTWLPSAPANAGVGFWWVVCREFDVDEKTVPQIKLNLEAASPEPANFKPASLYLRAKEAPAP